MEKLNLPAPPVSQASVSSGLTGMTAQSTLAAELPPVALLFCDSLSVQSPEGALENDPSLTAE